jgi:transposase
MQAVDGIVGNPSLLTADQKLWLARQQIDGKVTPKQLAKSHGLGRKVIRKYAARVKVGAKLHTRDGRPSLIDDALLHRILQKVKAEGSLTTDTIKRVIRSEYHQYSVEHSVLVLRRGKMEPKLISSRSLMRYVGKLQKLVASNTETP